jgi:hypothetical protein
MGGGNDGNSELPSNLEARDAHGNFGCNVNHIRTEGLRIVQHLAPSGEGPLYVPIEKEGEAG